MSTLPQISLGTATPTTSQRSGSPLHGTTQQSRAKGVRHDGAITAVPPARLWIMYLNIHRHGCATLQKVVHKAYVLEGTHTQHTHRYPASLVAYRRWLRYPFWSQVAFATCPWPLPICYMGIVKCFEGRWYVGKLRYCGATLSVDGERDDVCMSATARARFRAFEVNPVPLPHPHAHALWHVYFRVG